jgi:CBS domain-containing protein
MERAVTVDLIGTFEPQLVCCGLSDEIAGLLSNSTYAQFDYLPVRSDDRVVGLLSLRGLRDATMTPAGPTAGHAMRPLDQSILITSGTGVLRYIEEAEESPCRLVLRQTRIAGIVTISDLQKLPVRPALFLVVTHLELLMAAAIRSRFAGQFDEAWLALLGSRREGVEERWRDLNSKNLAIDRINATQFADKRRILIKSGLLQCSRSQAERELSAIERLRDSLAHASDYALTIESARSTICRAKLAQRWIKTLQQALSNRDRAPRSLSENREGVQRARPPA